MPGDSRFHWRWRTDHERAEDAEKRQDSGIDLRRVFFGVREDGQEQGDGDERGREEELAQELGDDPRQRETGRFRKGTRQKEQAREEVDALGDQRAQQHLLHH